MEKIVRVLISLIVLGIALAGAVFLVWPRYQEFSSLRMQVQAARDRLKQGEQTLQALRAVEAKVQEHEEDFAKLAQAVPQDGALPALYDHIQKLGVSSGLLLRSLEGQEQGEQEGRLVALKVRATFSGSYEAFKRFLDATQRSARLLNIDTFTIDGSGSDPEVLSFTFEIIAYAKP